MSTWQWEGVRRIVYGDATYIPICSKCCRFVKPDEEIRIMSDEPNCECSKCGRSTMIFEGFI